MKKILIFPLCLIFCGAMLIPSACADNPSNGHSVSGENEQTTSEGPDGPGAPEGNSGILIVYFSATGNTAELANYIHDRTGGDPVEIQPEIPYTAQDLNYNTPNMRPQVEHDTNARPAVSQETYDAIDIEQYDTIFVGYPIWWWTAPMIIGTFLNHYEWTADDNIYPFSQSASMNHAHFETSVQFVRENAVGATVHDGLFARASSASTIDAYLTANRFM